MYKVPLSLFIKSVAGEEYQVVKRGLRNILAEGKNITWKKEVQYQLYLKY